MTTEPSASTASTDKVPGVPDQPTADPDELRHRIEETRLEVGRTVEALAAKFDVKAQVTEKLAEVKEQLNEKQEEVSTRIAAVVDQAAEKVPAPASDAVRTVGAPFEQRPLLLAVAGAAVLVIVWKMVKR